MITMRNVVISTLFEEDFLAVADKLEELEANVIEKRYDLLYHRYEIYVRTTLRQSYKLRKFAKNHALSIMDFGS
jgi:hypothetical protein